VEGKENDDEHANKYANDDDKTDENDYNQTMITATTMNWETNPSFTLVGCGFVE
jgi:hypothetical protein